MRQNNTYLDRDDVSKALETLQAGGIILYPTDTIWGIGCDATNPEAVEKVFALKGRDQAKSMILLLHNDNQLAGYVNDIPDVAYQLIEVTDRPLTIIYSLAKNLPANVMAADGTVGIRVVDHPFCQQLLQRFRKPIISTSANLSGQPSPRNFLDISPEITEGADYVVQFGQQDTEEREPSMIIKLDPSGKFEFIRK
ncbi:L-threonylcarbamoyladenylate synthase [Sphingobacterium corticibacter]|uniref:L-threonylcarbamoyladenylate synthase n=1 Tax=Sphingobacterium corticibacter TaxID=2171749 RepID=A0A2T8HJ53_9SPHI|nr:L-threonylcarbamoyladenylate synthase [Sphingobacterium corticibacter]PVH25486.1 threonylcarbamoyl-AMP synthase [Sphingobacterium corticibacter]